MRTILGSTALCSLIACASHSPASDAASAADAITRSVYANDYNAAVSPFDDATKKTMTRDDVATLSAGMHALGDYTSLAQRSANPDTGKYEYDAAFTHGTLLVELRVDPDGKIGAYRVQTEATRAASKASPNG
jgi:hypothetical protein